MHVCSLIFSLQYEHTLCKLWCSVCMLEWLEVFYGQTWDIKGHLHTKLSIGSSSLSLSALFVGVLFCKRDLWYSYFLNYTMRLRKLHDWFEKVMHMWCIIWVSLRYYHLLIIGSFLRIRKKSHFRKKFFTH